MHCTAPVRLFKNLNPSEYPEGLLVPCGKCLACRIRKRSEWSIRMLHELEMWEHDAVFLTLTYDDDHLPDNCSLVKADLQKFFKRLRKRLSSDERKIRYFACGEYGDQSARPHYHAIVFGLTLKDSDKQCVIDSWQFCDWSVRSIRDNSFGLAEPDSINYVAQYIDKKFSGDLAVTEYSEKNREPVFRILSLGIGRDYVDKYFDKLSVSKKVTHNGKPMALPRYYATKLGITGGDLQSFAIESDRDIVEHYTGERKSDSELYRTSSAEEYIRYDKARKSAKAQHSMNLQARVDMRKRKI